MKKLFIIIVLFIFIYNPQYYNVNLIYILWPFVILYLLINFKRISRILINKYFILLWLLQLIIIFYLVVLLTLFNLDLANAGTSILNLLITIPYSLFFVSIIDTLPSVNNIKLINYLGIVALLQAVISILTFFIPSFQTFFLNIQNYGAQSEIYLQLSSHRLYGYSSNLTYAMPVFQGIIGIALLFYSDKIYRILFFSIPLILFSGIINARTVLVVVLIGLIMYLLTKYSNKINFGIIFLFGLLVLLVILVEPIDYRSDNNTINWVIRGLNEILLFFSGQESVGYFRYITNSEKYVLPQGINFIFGEGFRIMDSFNALGFQSDIGYINDIWLGGILYLGAVTIFFVVLFRNLFKFYKRHRDKGFLIFLILTILAINVKGVVFSYHQIFMFISLYYIDSLLRYIKYQNGAIQNGKNIGNNTSI